MPTKSKEYSHAKILNLTKSCNVSFSSVILNLCLTQDTSSSKLSEPAVMNYEKLITNYILRITIISYICRQSMEQVNTTGESMHTALSVLKLKGK